MNNEEGSVGVWWCVIVQRPWGRNRLGISRDMPRA